MKVNNKKNVIYHQLADIVLSNQGTSPYTVAINGKDASGKTIFADNFASYLKTKTNRQIIRISLDDFMNERRVRRTITPSEGETCYLYTFNFDLFKKYVLEPLRTEGNKIYKTKVFDYHSDKPAYSEDKKADNNAIVIIDGVFLFKDDLINYWSLKILLEVSDDIIIERGAERDTNRIGDYDRARQQYIDRYVKSQVIYYKETHPLERADIVVDNNNYESPKIITSKI